MSPESGDPREIAELGPEVTLVPTAASDEAKDVPEAEVEAATSALGQAQVQEEAAAAPSQRQAHIADPVRRGALLPWVIAFGVLLSLGVVGLGLSYTSLFSAKVISVTGQNHLSRAQVLRAAGLGPGTNLLHADLGGAERRLEQDPWVAEAAVTRRLPGTLTIVVRERVPSAITGGGAAPLLFVSAEGTTMGQARGDAPLPRIVSPEGAAMPSAQDLVTGAAAAAAMPPALRPRIATIAVDPNGEITVLTKSRIVVTYGDATQLAAKGQSLRAVLDWAGREAKPITTVDVTVPGAPTAALAGGVLVAR